MSNGYSSYDAEAALPQFNQHQSGRQQQMPYHQQHHPQQSVQKQQLPHQGSFSSHHHHQQFLSQPPPATITHSGGYSPGSSSAYLAADPYASSNRYQNNRTSSPMDTGSTSLSTSTFALLGRSASLGGPSAARRRDPFGNQRDDVERALGSDETDVVGGNVAGRGAGGAGGAGIGWASHPLPQQPYPGSSSYNNSYQANTHRTTQSMYDNSTSASSAAQRQGLGVMMDFQPTNRGGGAYSDAVMTASPSTPMDTSGGPPPAARANMPPPALQSSYSGSSNSVTYSAAPPVAQQHNPYVPQQQQNPPVLPSQSSSNNAQRSSWADYSPHSQPLSGLSIGSGGDAASLTQSQNRSPPNTSRAHHQPPPPPRPVSTHQQQPKYSPPMQQQQSSIQQSPSLSGGPSSFSPHPYAPPLQQQQGLSPVSAYSSTLGSNFLSGTTPPPPVAAYHPNQQTSHRESHDSTHRYTPSPKNQSAVASGMTGTQQSSLYGLPQPPTTTTATAGGPPPGDGPPRAKPGFKKIRDARDLKAFSGGAAYGSGGSRSDGELSPLKSLTTFVAQTYSQHNPAFTYESARNPRRVLTKPSKGVLNDGVDNEDNDYILFVNDMLGGESGHKFLILDVLGQGTFGQVVKCQNMKTNEIVAVKVVKNKPAYFNQSMMEVAILDELNNKLDPEDKHNILRMRANFIHRKHLCLVFECLSSNLYELIKQNSFKGLSTQLVKVFTTQLLDTLSVLQKARLIHCDLKPENILLKSLSSPQIKVIDFGSTCYENSTVYTYIQSRFYRSPEVLLGLPYSTSIDMWSLGCIAVELFLGLPLFPGTSEYNQISRIIDMLGLPPNHLLDHGKQVSEFFNAVPNPRDPTRRSWELKSMEQFSREHKTQEQPSKQYFKATTLPEIIRQYPLPKKNMKPAEVEKEMGIRASFTDFVLGLLALDPIMRWSPQEAALHPFITGEKFNGPFEPRSSRSMSPVISAAPADPKRPYGGLVSNPSASRGPRAYQDAASYNQQLAQHQTYTAQQQQHAAAAARYLQQNPFAAPRDDSAVSYSSHHQQQQQMQQQQQAIMMQQAQVSNQNQNRMSMNQVQQSPYSARNSMSGLMPPAAVANPGSNSYHPSGSGRSRANTVNQMDLIPAQIARLATLGVDINSSSRGALTPVMNRDREDAMREWERRTAAQAGGKRNSTQNVWPQLEQLEESAGLWNNRFGTTDRQYTQQMMPDVDTNSRRHSRRESGMGGSSLMGAPPSPGSAASIHAPPQAYQATPNRYSNQFQSAYNDPYDPLSLVPSLQPQQAYGYMGGSGHSSVPSSPQQHGQFGYSNQQNLTRKKSAQEGWR